MPPRTPSPAGDVFVTGYPRSGTTLLYKVLAATGAFGPAPPMTGGSEDSAFETAIAFFANPEIDHREVLRNAWPHWSLAIPDRDERERVFAAHANMGPIRRAWERGLTRWIFRDRGIADGIHDIDDLATRRQRSWSAWRLRSLGTKLSVRRKILRDFLSAFRKSQKAGAALEKYPFHYYYLFELASALPDAKFIFIYRDPRDVFASMIRRARLQVQQHVPVGVFSWQFISAASFARDWNLSLELASEFERVSPSRLLRVKYEDLTERTVPTLERMSSFLGLGRPITVAGVDEEPDPTRKFPLVTSKPQRNTAPYRSLLHPADVAMIEFTCGSELQALGYATPDIQT